MVRRQFIALDFLRFLTAFCVLLFHYEMFVRRGVAPERRVFRGFDSGVDFFFILSGFVIAHSSADKLTGFGSYLSFLQRRLARIYPLHILTLLAALGLAFVAVRLGLGINDPERFNPRYLVGNIFLTHAWGVHDRLSFNLVSWSISAEWFLYLTFPLTLLIVRRLGPVGSVIGIALLLAALDVAAAEKLMTHWRDRTFNAAMIRALPAFALGIALWLAWQRIAFRWRAPWWAAALTYAAAVVAMVRPVAPELTLLLFAATVLVTALAEDDRFASNRTGRVMHTLGNASFGLYMLHHLIGFVLFTGVGPRLHLHPVVVAVLATVLSLGGAILSFRYFEDPLRRTLGRRFQFTKARIVDESPGLIIAAPVPAVATPGGAPAEHSVPRGLLET